LIRSLLKLSYKNYYISKFNIVAEVIAILATLLIYSFTSRAFSSSVEGHLSIWDGASYFNYLIIGEIILLLPTYFIQQFSGQVKLSLHNGTFETLLHLPISPLKSIMSLGSLGLMSELIRSIMTIILAIVFFNFSIPSSSLVYLLVIQSLAILCFLGIGLIAVSLLIITGRGQVVVNYFCLFGGFFSGAYFPLEVFPSYIAKWGHLISPFSTVLIYSRQLILAPNSSTLLECLKILLPMTLIFLFLSTLSFKIAIKRWRLNDNKLIFTR